MLNPTELKVSALELSNSKNIPFDNAVNILLTEHDMSGVRFTLAEIASVFGITRERVRQIEKTALKKIKRSRAGGELGEYL